jgi:hypothetical protein
MQAAVAAVELVRLQAQVVQVAVARATFQAALAVMQLQTQAVAVAVAAQAHQVLAAMVARVLSLLVTQALKEAQAVR